MGISGAFEVIPRQFKDDRGMFCETYRYDLLEENVGHSLDLRQANLSVSRKGVLRGVHFADIPRGQAKYVTVPHGSIIDYVVDLRVGSETFGKWESLLLDGSEGKAVYLPEGLGHAFLSLEEGTVVTYLVSDVFHPEREHAINPLDSDLALIFPLPQSQLRISPKDTAAPSLQEALSSGLLPQFEVAQNYYSTLKGQK
nr:dTDP-4-dehydrorhamnose 3,5-epimerase [Alpinimonas psychrophila]